MTGASGAFAFEGVPATWMALTVTAPGHLERITGLVGGGRRDGLRIDAISLAPPFSLDFYRQFARGGYEGPLRTLKPWTVSPSFYVRTVTEDTGEPVAAFVIDGVKRVFERAVPELTGGRLAVAAFETGAQPAVHREGWVSVTFRHDMEPGLAGSSTVGPEGARLIQLRYDPLIDREGQYNPLHCESFTVSVADHEIVHMMGFRHTDDTFRDFHSGHGCPGAGRPERVRHHAALVYTRPYGNRDPDADPVGYSAASTAADDELVTCPVDVVSLIHPAHR
ncbi:MAG: hypothetical protein R2752_07685 [Vicinamibacterales bacterium]